MATRFHSLSLDVTIVLSFYKRSLFSNKSKASNMKTLSENVNLIIDDQKCAGVFNNCFNSVVKELNIPTDQNLSNVHLYLMIILCQLYTSTKDIPVTLILRKRSKNMTFFFFIMLMLRIL